MKNWSIEEFLQQCQELQDNPYTYDYSHMPAGICNGHKVIAYASQWSSIAIDDGIINLRPVRCLTYQDSRFSNSTMSSMEYVKCLLESEI